MKSYLTLPYLTLPYLTLVGLLGFSPANAQSPAGGDAVVGDTAVVKNAISWTFLHEWQPTEPYYADVVQQRFTDVAPKDLASRLRGMVKLDEKGVWQASEVDSSLLDPELVAAVANEIEMWQPDSKEPEVEEWVRDSYTIYDLCDGDPSTDEIRLWDSESRVKKTAPFTSRQESAVFLTTMDSDDNPTGRCSGILVRSQWVLTASHCVVDDNGVFSVAPGKVVLTDVYGNDINSNLIASNTGYMSSPNYGDDWALIRMVAPFPSSPPDMMDIYTGADSAYDVIDDHVHNLAYPSYTYDGGCLQNDKGSVMPLGAELYHQGNAEVSNILTKRLRYKSDSGPRASGSGYYFCPAGADDVCGAGEEGRVIGVHAGFISRGVNRRHVGPKATNFGATAISIMDAN